LSKLSSLHLIQAKEIPHVGLSGSSLPPASLPLSVAYDPRRVSGWTQEHTRCLDTPSACSAQYAVVQHSRTGRFTAGPAAWRHSLLSPADAADGQGRGIALAGAGRRAECRTLVLAARRRPPPGWGGSCSGTRRTASASWLGAAPRLWRTQRGRIGTLLRKEAKVRGGCSGAVLGGTRLLEERQHGLSARPAHSGALRTSM